MSASTFPPWPWHDEDEIDAVAAVLRSGRVNLWTGGECSAFESEFAQWCGTRHAVAVANGTVALELCLKGLEIDPGDEVIVSPRSFIASASCVVSSGAVPVFADVDPVTGNLSPETMEAVRGPRTRAAIVVHIAGWSADMTAIMQWSQANGVAIIEDCAQAHGARHAGRSVGAFGHVAAWSFCQDKIMSTGGEGGMVTTSDPAIHERVWSAKDHGKSQAAVHSGLHEPGFRWVHSGFGGNGRMTEMQAAIGRIQLRKLPGWHAARAANAHEIAGSLTPLAQGGVLHQLPADSPDGSVHGWYRYLFQISLAALRPGWTRQRIVDAIGAQGVPAFVGPCPEIYREQAFDGTGWRPAERLPAAQMLGETSIAMLLHPTIPASLARQSGEVAATVIREATGS